MNDTRPASGVLVVGASSSQAPGIADELASSPSAPAELPDGGWVVDSGVSYYPDGAACILHECSNGRSFPFWLRVEEMEQILAASESRAIPPGFPLTTALPAPETLKERMEFLLVRSRSANAFQCYALLRDPDEEIALERGLTEAWILLRFTKTGLFVAKVAQEEFSSEHYPPGDWIVTSDLPAEGHLRIATVCCPGKVRIRLLVIAAGLLGLNIWAGMSNLPLLLGLGWLAFGMLLDRYLWWMFGHRSWRLAPNALEMRDSFLGIAKERRIVGGTLVVGPARKARAGRYELAVEERGRRRTLVGPCFPEYAWMLGEFVRGYTGWPLKRED